ncbi:MAG: MFS transporter [Anaerolineae bacterium]|nr:MFS transporter [Anaerolineae bacterium]
MKIASSSLGPQITLLSLIRLVMNVSVRMIYPFLPIFASGLGVSVTSLSLAISTRSLIGTLNPLVSSAITDRRGRKTGMLTGIGLFVIANLAVVFWPSFPVLFASMTVSLFGMLIFMSAMQAYMADEIAYERRGRALALSELAWSVSYFIGMPVVAFLLSRFGWVGPFPALAGLGLVSFVLVARLVPRTPPVASKNKSNLADLRRILTYPPALMALCMCMLFSASNELLNVVFGVWMKGTFGLEIAGLGLASTIIGIAELCGEAVVALVVDRLGKVRSIRSGLVLSTLAVIMLFLWGRTVVSALVILFIYVLGYETMAVSNLPLMSEVMPEARATMLGLMVAFFSIGRAITALLAVPIYNYGFQYTILAIVCVNIVAFILLYLVKVTNPHLNPSVEASGQ